MIVRVPKGLDTRRRSALQRARVGRHRGLLKPQSRWSGRDLGETGETEGAEEGPERLGATEDARRGSL